MQTLLNVPIKDIRIMQGGGLRDEQKNLESYKELTTSIKNKGMLGSIIVRPLEGEDGVYELVDGLQRFSICRDLGHTSIPCEVNTTLKDAASVLETQLMMNVHRVETRPVEYTNQLQRLLTLKPTMTKLELASQIGKSLQWLSERLGLLKITDARIQTLINEGKVNIANACALAKLPENEQAEWVDRAMTQNTNEFVPAAIKRAREVAAAKRQGRAAEKGEWTPIEHVRSVKEIVGELSTLESLKSLIHKNNITNPVEAAKMALNWSIHMDPVSVEIQKKEHEDRVARHKAEAEKRKAERQAKKDAEAAAAKTSIFE